MLHSSLSIEITDKGVSLVSTIHACRSVRESQRSLTRSFSDSTLHVFALTVMCVHFPIVGMCMYPFVVLMLTVCIFFRSWNSSSSSGCGCGCAPGSSGCSGCYSCCFADLQKVSIVVLECG